MSDKPKYEGKHRDPEGRSERWGKKTEPEILGVPLSKKVRKNDRKEDSDKG
jgi:hypothetical protein